MSVISIFQNSGEIIPSFRAANSSIFRYQGPPGVTGELVTPTGAALLRALTKNMKKENHIEGRPPNFTIRKLGIGAGTKDYEKHPNILRLLLGDSLTKKE